ncbi:hypothetical protein BSKO_07079 [Bryopsis sp. KO-2023]|nr:hypothetical protein BSKO_07079 [Bryopsis sp. KO-2023]
MASNRRAKKTSTAFENESRWPLFVLIAVRTIGAAANLIHDCDEVYNYWEPLHFLLHGFGRQTWEYSSEFGLRSYLYILLHWLVAFPVKLVTGNGQSKLAAFFAVRIVFGLISAMLENYLYRVVRRWHAPSAFYFLIILASSSGMFVSTTSFLPSTFAMYTLMAASAGIISRNMTMVIVPAVIGVVVGWPVAGIAFIPLALYVLLQPNLAKSFSTLFASLIGTIGLLVAADTFFYGKLTVSQWNFIKYNVFGGGQSDLYGVEPWGFYVRNGLNNFNIALPLALSLPLVALVAWMFGATDGGSRKETRASDAMFVRVGVVCLSFFVWMLAISLLPHKEERFMYVVFPQICLAAALSLSAVQNMASKCFGISAGKALVILILAAQVPLSIMRTSALLANYSAPMHVYSHLPANRPESTKDTHGFVNVCVGDEWHRFPSSFFLPSPAYRLQFLKQGFSGLLPAPFESTSASPPLLNDKNIEAPSLYHNLDDCHFLIDFEVQGRALLKAQDDNIEWVAIVEKPFLENSLSPKLFRALYIPFVSQEKNHFGRYVLYERRIE